MLVYSNFMVSDIENEFLLRAKLYKALDEVRYPIHDVPETVRGEDTSIYPVLAAMGDLDVFDGELGEPQDGGGLVKVRDADELYQVLHIADAELGVSNSGPEKLAKIGHEHQHAVAARALGLRAIHAVRFVATTSGCAMKVTTLPVGGPVTKLGFASMIAHPRILSRSDVVKLTQIGYRSPEDVAKRIIRYEATSIPLPMSVNINSLDQRT